MSAANRCAISILCSLAFTVILAVPAGAEEGVTATSILIGQSAGLTGNLAERVKPAVAAANMYFDEVNRRGGVNGRGIKFLSIDDKSEVANSVENTKRLIENEGCLRAPAANRRGARGGVDAACGSEPRSVCRAADWNDLVARAQSLRVASAARSAQ